MAKIDLDISADKETIKYIAKSTERWISKEKGKETTNGQKHAKKKKTICRHKRV